MKIQNYSALQSGVTPWLGMNKYSFVTNMLINKSFFLISE